MCFRYHSLANFYGNKRNTALFWRFDFQKRPKTTSRRHGSLLLILESNFGPLNYTYIQPYPSQYDCLFLGSVRKQQWCFLRVEIISHSVVGFLGQCLTVCCRFVHFTLDDKVSKCDAKSHGVSTLDHHHLGLLYVVPRRRSRGLQYTIFGRHDSIV